MLLLSGKQRTDSKRSRRLTFEKLCLRLPLDAEIAILGQAMPEILAGATLDPNDLFDDSSVVFAPNPAGGSFEVESAHVRVDNVEFGDAVLIQNGLVQSLRDYALKQGIDLPDDDIVRVIDLVHSINGDSNDLAAVVNVGDETFTLEIDVDDALGGGPKMGPQPFIGPLQMPVMGPVPQTEDPSISTSTAPPTPAPPTPQPPVQLTQPNAESDPPSSGGGSPAPEPKEEPKEEPKKEPEAPGDAVPPGTKEPKNDGVDPKGKIGDPLDNGAPKAPPTEATPKTAPEAGPKAPLPPSEQPRGQQTRPADEVVPRPGEKKLNQDPMRPAENAPEQPGAPQGIAPSGEATPNPNPPTPKGSNSIPMELPKRAEGADGVAAMFFDFLRELGKRLNPFWAE